MLRMAVPSELMEVSSTGTEEARVSVVLSLGI